VAMSFELDLRARVVSQPSDVLCESIALAGFDVGAVVAEVHVLQDAVLFRTETLLGARQARAREAFLTEPGGAVLTGTLFLRRAPAQHDRERAERYEHGRPLRHPPHTPHLTTPSVQTTQATYHRLFHGSILAALFRRDR